MEDAKKLSTKMKINELSYNIVKKKFEIRIADFLSQVDPKDTKKLTIDMIGKFMWKINVYKIYYNDKYLHCKEKDEYIIGIVNLIIARETKEIAFHKKFWEILGYKEFVPSELLKQIMILLSESYCNRSDILADHIEGNLLYYIDAILCFRSLVPDKNHSLNESITEKINKYSLHSSAKTKLSWKTIIEKFKGLVGPNFFATVAVTNKYSKIKSKPPLHSPTINNKSRILDKEHIERYLSDNSLDLSSEELSKILWYKIDIEFDSSIDEACVKSIRSKSTDFTSSKKFVTIR